MYSQRLQHLFILLFIIALILIPPALVSANTSTVVGCQPQNAISLVGQDVPISIHVQDISNLYAAEIQATYTTDAISGTLTTDTDFFSADFILRQQLSGGIINYAATQLAPSGPISGSGSLFDVTWHATQPTTLTLDLTHADLGAVDGSIIDATLEDCTVKFAADLQGAVTSAEPGETVIVPIGSHTIELVINENTTLVGGGSAQGNMPTFTLGSLLKIIARTVTLKGFNFAELRPDFVGTGGQLIAYGNNIENFQSFSGDGTVDLRYNYWGNHLQKPARLSDRDWSFRLGAPVEAFQDGSQDVRLKQARVSGANGRLSVVDHGRPAIASAAPFGAAVTGNLPNLCSNFYDMFVRDGSGAYQVELTADDDARCQTVVDNKEVYYMTDINRCASGPCWQRFPSDRIEVQGKKLILQGLNSAELSGTPFVIGDPGATVGSPLPSIAAPDVAVLESAGTAVVTVTLSAASAETITLNYQTADGTRGLGDMIATAGLDYVASASQLIFAPGELQKQIEITLLEDPLYEWNHEQFHIAFQDTSNAHLSRSQTIITIVDNDFGIILPIVTKR